MNTPTRREFLQALGGTAAFLLGRNTRATVTDVTSGTTPRLPESIPSYLRGFEDAYRENPRAAAIAWHRQAEWGLFIHYALESLRGMKASEVLALRSGPKDKWAEFKSGADVDYAALEQRFTASGFDADAITDLALAAEMRYVTFTTRHRGDLCLFRTKTTAFNSLNSPARRDLVAELATACAKKGLGLFLYCPPDVARTEPQAQYDRNRTQLTELLTQYGPVAGIWFDGIGSYYEEPAAYSRLGELYALVRSLQPQCLISFKQGTGTEDFVAPEGLMHAKRGALAEKAWNLNRGKRGDICTVMQTAPTSWLYLEGCKHIDGREALALLADAFAQAANLTLNTGLRPDGSIDPADTAALREAGEFIRLHGYPAPVRMDRKKRIQLKDKDA